MLRSVRKHASTPHSRWKICGSTKHAGSARPAIKSLKALVIAVCLVLSGLAMAQETESEPPVTPVAIALSEIPARAIAVSDSLSESEELLNRGQLLDEIESDFTQQDVLVAKNLVGLRNALAAASSRDALSELELEWQESARLLTSWDDDLRRIASIIEKEVIRLDNSAEVWASTIAEAQAAGTAPDLLELARTTAASIDSVRQALGAVQSRTFALQGKLGRTQGSVQTAQNRIADEEASLLNNLLRRERPPLWSDTVYGTSIQTMTTRASNELAGSWDAIAGMVGGELDRLGFQFIFFVAIGVLLGRARLRARSLAEADPLIKPGMTIFERPFSIAALIALMLTPRLYLATPPQVYDAINLLMLIPILRLVSPLLDVKLRPPLYLLAGLYVIDWFRDLLEAAPLVARLIFIVEMLAAIALIIWVVRSKALHRPGAERIQGALRFSLDIALGLTSLAALATVAGFVRLGVLLGTGVVNAAYLAVLLFAVMRAAEAVIALFLRSAVAQHIRFIAQRRPGIRTVSIRIVRLLSVGIWAYAVLDLFALRDYLIDIGSKVLFTELKVGALAFSLADFLAFGLTIVAAVMIARIIIIILEEDVYPRMSLGRGVPFAISSVIKYALITVGFLLAVGAMGIGMDRITILLGAFGVGLGFGLQTIINNFVSGMILVFERPVQVNDSIEVGGVKGKITRIGIRSSTIRTFDGADVTVPNGTLLSDALTNWTMSDRHRRLEVNVGIAYGTDPDTVIRLLGQALAEQDGLLEDPAPAILFMGFGDSSLDFSIRAWVEDNAQYVTVQSALALKVNRILGENGIEIPFPQRDVYLRSVPPGVASSAEPA